MTHADPKARRDARYRVNLSHYQAEAVNALARLHRKQAATYLAEIIEAHLDEFIAESEKPAEKITNVA